jgi:TPR repeat protein
MLVGMLALAGGVGSAGTPQEEGPILTPKMPMVDCPGGCSAQNKKSTEIPLSKLLATARAGNAEAQAKLGEKYLVGSKELPQNFDAAFECFRKAAAQGNARGEWNLGGMYDYGRGAPKDPNKAILWYKKAAAQGNADAELSLGTKYESGEGVTQDNQTALEWYRKAALGGSELAQTMLGSDYLNGFNVPADVSEAIKWFRMAAEQGDFYSEEMLGKIYRGGENGAEQDGEQGMQKLSLTSGKCTTMVMELKRI